MLGLAGPASGVCFFCYYLVELVLDGIVGLDFFFAAAQRCEESGFILQGAGYFGLEGGLGGAAEFFEEMIVGGDRFFGAI